MEGNTIAAKTIGGVAATHQRRKLRLRYSFMSDFTRCCADTLAEKPTPGFLRPELIAPGSTASGFTAPGTIVAASVPAAATSMALPVASSPDLDEELISEEAFNAAFEGLADTPWSCLVWDDPVNLMTYVVHVFRTVLGVDLAEANRLMLQVHNEGKAMVATGDREKMEQLVKTFHSYGLQSTMQQI